MGGVVWNSDDSLPPGKSLELLDSRRTQLPTTELGQFQRDHSGPVVGYHTGSCVGKHSDVCYEFVVVLDLFVGHVVLHL